MVKAFYISDLPTTIINESKLVSLEEAALFMTNRGDKYAYFDFKSKLNCYFLVLQTRELNAAGVVIKEGTLYLPNIFIKPGEIFSTEEALPLEKDCFSLELFIKYAEFDEKVLFNDQKITKKTEEILLATKTFMPNLTPEIGMSNAPTDYSWKNESAPKASPFALLKKKNKEEAVSEEQFNLEAEIAKLQEEKVLNIENEHVAQPMDAMPQAAPLMQEAPTEAPVQNMDQQAIAPAQEQPVPPMPEQTPAPEANQQLPLVKAKVRSNLPIIAMAIAAVLFIALIFFVIYYQSLFVSQAQ